MTRFHTFKWNKWSQEYTMLILTEEDITSETDYAGAGFEILILPSKFKDTKNQYLDTAIKIATVRCGEVIYI